MQNKSIELSLSAMIEMIKKYNKKNPEFEKWYLTSKDGLDETLSNLSDFNCIIIGQKSKETGSEIFQRLAKNFNENICKIRLDKKTGQFYIGRAASKISARLQTFTEEELHGAIKNFSEDQWWMEHCGHNGLHWFCWSNERIDKFLSLKNKGPISRIEKVDPAILKLQLMNQRRNEKTQKEN